MFRHKYPNCLYVNFKCKLLFVKVQCLDKTVPCFDMFLSQCWIIITLTKTSIPRKAWKCDSEQRAWHHNRQTEATQCNSVILTLRIYACTCVFKRVNHTQSVNTQILKGGITKCANRNFTHTHSCTHIFPSYHAKYLSSIEHTRHKDGARMPPIWHTKSSHAKGNMFSHTHTQHTHKASGATHNTRDH